MSNIRHIKLPSGLYGFQRKDIGQFRYRDFLLSNVFEKLNPDQSQACVELWRNHGVITSAEAAHERAKQVCYYITHVKTGELVGVNTLYIDQLESSGPQYWFNRMFLNPHHRDTRLMIIGTAMTLAFGKLNLAQRGPLGIINVNENRKLSRPAMQRVFQRLGYQHIGYQQGNEVILFDFATTEFID